MTPESAAALFLNATLEKRVEVMMKAGRISMIPEDCTLYVLAQMRLAVAEAVAAERAACIDIARRFGSYFVAEAIQQERGG